jgi:hypothetical protein
MHGEEFRYFPLLEIEYNDQYVPTLNLDLLIFSVVPGGNNDWHGLLLT